MDHGRRDIKTEYVYSGGEYLYLVYFVKSKEVQMKS